MHRTVAVDRGRLVAWRNGRGTTRELLREPDRDDWTWRLSVATSVEAAPFSTFEGIERELLLLRGVLDLRFGSGSSTRLEPGQHVRFSGETAVVGTPAEGATEQLNVMWRRDRVRVGLALGAEQLPAGCVEVVTVQGLGSPCRVWVASLDHPGDLPGTTSPVRKPGR